MHSLVYLIDKRRQAVTLPKVLRHDILTWLAVAVAGAAINLIVLWLVVASTGVDTEAARANASLALSGPTLLIAGFLACLALVQSKGWRLWVVYILTVAIVSFSHDYNLIIRTVDLALLNFIVVAITLLAIIRVAEYINIRYFIKLDDFDVSLAAKLLYIAIILIGLLATSTIIGKLY